MLSSCIFSLLSPPFTLGGAFKNPNAYLELSTVNIGSVGLAGLIFS